MPVTSDTNDTRSGKRGTRVQRKHRPALPEVRDDSLALDGRLRDLRAVAQSLRDFFAGLKERADAMADPELRQREVHTSFEQALRVLDHDRQELESRLSEIRGILERDDKVYADYGDVLARLQISWEEVLSNWPIDPNTEDGVIQRLPKIITSLDAIVYDSGLVTIPNRIRDHLVLLPIGGSLSLRDAYSDELPRPEDQRRLLRYLSYYPGFISGLVDLDNECITRASPKTWRRSLTLVLTVGLALMGFGVIGLACALDRAVDLTEWPFKRERLGELLFGYAFLLLGALAHIIINLLKQDRAGGSSRQGLADWILRIHVKEASFLISAISFWLGAVAMAFLFAKTDWKTAFFLGYSYDSFVELFLQRFERAVAPKDKEERREYHEQR